MAEMVAESVRAEQDDVTRLEFCFTKLDPSCDVAVDSAERGGENMVAGTGPPLALRKRTEVGGDRVDRQLEEVVVSAKIRPAVTDVRDEKTGTMVVDDGDGRGRTHGSREPESVGLLTHVPVGVYERAAENVAVEKCRVVTAEARQADAGREASVVSSTHTIEYGGENVAIATFDEDRVFILRPER